jgi:hypothetical protein
MARRLRMEWLGGVNHAIWLILALSMTVIFGCTCAAPKNEPDPLTGWTFRTFDEFLPSAYQQHYHLEKSVTDDYETFIKTNNLKTFGPITGFFEDGTGQRAVEFEAFPGEPNASWNYVLIYNKENKRIRVIRYGYKRYQS